MRPDHRIVREAYKDAYRVRQRTGQSDDALLQSALRVRAAAATFLEDGPVHDALFALWHEGVAPELVTTTTIQALGAVAAATPAPRPRFRQPWVDLPTGHRALSSVRRATGLLRRHAHRPVDLVPLTFTPLPTADRVLRRFTQIPPRGRSPWSEVKVWLRTGPAAGSAAVLVGETETGTTSLPQPVWSELQREAAQGVYADGRLEVTRNVAVPDAVTVGGLFCHLPRL